jgi:glycosyltransferase involved in cell wall biosynthesis
MIVRDATIRKLEVKMINEKKTVPVSVIIPCYNSEKTIFRALRSVEQQSIRPTEVLVIDDASNDNTLAILREYESLNQDWIKVIAMKVNSGPSRARNAGWDAATQEYIAFLDSDDSWHPEKLSIQYSYMRDNSDIALSGHLLGSGDLNTINVNNSFRALKINPSQFLFKNYFATPTVMIKRDVELRFDANKKYCEDMYLWQQVLYSGYNVVRIELPLASIHKLAFGESGLSAKLWDMESGEIDNFILLWRSGFISMWLMILSCTFSLIKFVRRLIIYFARKSTKGA